MPDLILDPSRCRKNIDRMAGKARRSGLEFRPHFKTHQSAEIGHWFRDCGVRAITVSSFRMAGYFAQSGWEDILVAFPFPPGERETLNRIPHSVRVSILLDHPGQLSFLRDLNRPVGYFIDVDTGYGRTGVPAESPGEMESLIEEAASQSHLHFLGFYCHAGHSYHAKGDEGGDAIHRKAITDLERLRQQFSHLSPRLLYGDTPGCSRQEEFGSIDAITPGNFVFYDLFQQSIGSCDFREIAVAMECRVAGIYEDGDRILVHGGAVHFSKESLVMNGSPVFGQVAYREADRWEPLDPPVFVTSLSQEHGLIHGAGEWGAGRSVGDILHILPVHSCLSANLMNIYRTLDNKVIEKFHTT